MSRSCCQYKRRTETVRLLCKQACKPGSVIEDSHLSWRIVAGTLQPPPENGRAGHVFSHGVAPDRVYSDELFPVIGRALISAFPPLPRRRKGIRFCATPIGERGGLSLLHFSWGRPRRVLPVILALWSPDFPHPQAFRPASAAVQLTCVVYFILNELRCQIRLKKANG